MPLTRTVGRVLPSLSFRVDGMPRPQGSMRAFAYRRVTGTLATRVISDDPNLNAWRMTVAQSARAALPPGRVTYAGPVIVGIVFALYRPRRARRLPTTRPDIDKLARGILDALTGVVWLDDAQVVSLTASKRYADVGEQPHASVVIAPARQLPVSDVD